MNGKNTAPRMLPGEGGDSFNGQAIAFESFRRTVMEHLPQAIFLKDADSRYVYCNRTFASDLGIEPEEIRGRTDEDFFPERLARHYRSMDERVMQTGETLEVEEKYVRQGREITVKTVKIPVRSSDGKVAGVLGIFWDITREKQAEEAERAAKARLESKVLERTSELRESEKKFKTLFESAGDIILIHDFDGKILDSNTTASEMLGYSSEHIRGLGLQDIETPEFAERLSERLAEVRQSKSAVYQSSYLASGGASIPVEVNSRVFEYGGSRCILSVCRDITERMAAEEAMLESAEKLRSYLDRSVEALASASEKRDPYTSGHQERVCALALAVAAEMHLPEETQRALALAAKIHDIGKLYVPAEILGKPRRLYPSEFAIVMLHASAGYDIARKIDFPQPVARAILQHHERLDGSGYPMRLKGTAISLPARILAAADVVEAMTAHRPYRPARPLDEALAELREGRNTLYDPEIAEACLELLKSGKFEFGQAELSLG